MAVIDKYCKVAIEFAKEIEKDIVINNGINWIWAHGFKSHENATKFDNFCENNGCETRGVYSGNAADTYDVRFR